MTTTEATVLHGVVDMPEAEYHVRPELSCSGARKLLPPFCPAIYRYDRDHPTYKEAFDFGHVAHRLVLGAGQDIEVIDAPDYRTKDAREQRDLARVEGRSPVLAHDYKMAEDMAASVLAHPLAAALMTPGEGKPEQSLFWADVNTGARLRGRVDWLPAPSQSRPLVVDFKTSVSAHPGRFARSAADYGYAQQAAWYLDGVRALDLGDEPAFLFVVVEKTPPFLVTVIELDDEATRLGRALNRRAIDVYADCSANNHWPGYSGDVEQVSLPVYYVRAKEEELFDVE